MQKIQLSVAVKSLISNINNVCFYFHLTLHRRLSVMHQHKQNINGMCVMSFETSKLTEDFSTKLKMRRIHRQ